jgi:hypothetical protein
MEGVMKRVIAGAAIVVVIGAYLVGYWPQRRQVAVLEAEVATLHDRVADLEARNRAAALLGELLNVIDAVGLKDYGRAQQLSSTFFDHVRVETTTSSIESVRSGLSSILGARDAVTSALARADGQVIDQLQKLGIQLRATLGYPTAAIQAS